MNQFTNIPTYLKYMLINITNITDYKDRIVNNINVCQRFSLHHSSPLIQSMNKIVQDFFCHLFVYLNSCQVNQLIVYLNRRFSIPIDRTLVIASCTSRFKQISPPNQAA